MRSADQPQDEIEEPLRECISHRAWIDCMKVSITRSTKPGRKHQAESGRRRAESPVERAQHQLVGKLTETKVPALSPELAKGRGAERCRHDGFCIDARALPQETYDLEGAEVKQQD